MTAPPVERKRKRARLAARAAKARVKRQEAMQAIAGDLVPWEAVEQAAGVLETLGPWCPVPLTGEQREQVLRAGTTGLVARIEFVVLRT